MDKDPAEGPKNPGENGRLEADSTSREGVAPKGWGILRTIRFLILFLAASIVLAAVFHGPILRMVSSTLVHEDPLPNGDYSVLLFGMPQWSEAYDRVISLLPGGEPVVVMKGKRTRLMRLGLEKPWWQTDIDQLAKKGATRFEFLEDPSARHTHQFVPLVSQWLDAHPGKSLCVCHDRFYGKILERILARHLDGEKMRRLSLLPVNPPDFDPGQWWRKKEGQGAIIAGYSNLIFDIFFGDGEKPGPDWDPVAYGESLP